MDKANGKTPPPKHYKEAMETRDKIERVLHSLEKLLDWECMDE